MRRWVWILAVLFLASPLAAAPTTLFSLVPDGHGGLTAFVGIGKAVYAIPVDASGVSHPELARLVFDDLSQDAIFAIAKTDGGWLTAFSDANGIAYTEPLSADFSSLRQARALGRDSLLPLRCSGDVCAAVRQIKRTLLLVDTTGAVVGELSIDPNWLSVTATSNGFAVLWETRATDTSPWDLHIEFIDRAGQITASSVIATRNDFFPATAIPHPLGASVITTGQSDIGVQIVRTDGTVAAQASYRILDLAGVSAVAAGGQIMLAFTTFLAHSNFPLPSPPPRYAAYAMRVSESSLAILEGPVDVAPGAVSATIGPIAASGDAFFALWSSSNTPLTPNPFEWSPVYDTHMLRIPLTGPVEPSASVPFRIIPPGRRRPSTR